MARWKFGNAFSPAEFFEYLATANNYDYNHDLNLPLNSNGLYHHICSHGVVGQESPGLPLAGGAFEIGCKAILNYSFSDPKIVSAFFEGPLIKQNSTVLIEMKSLGLYIVSAARIVAIRRIATPEFTQFGFRYDTLEGHVESGAEWFLLSKDHATGNITFRITAAMKPGNFPNPIFHAGYLLTGKYYRRKWHRHAYSRLRNLFGFSDDLKVSIETGPCSLGFVDDQQPAR